jgi:MFS family permease
MPHKARQSLILWLSVTQLISWGSVFYLFALIMGPIQDTLGLGRAEVSVAFSMSLLMEGLVAYPIGRLIDKGHERLVMTGGSLLLCLGLALHSFVAQAWQFYAVWVLLGTGCAMTLYTPAFAVLTRRFPLDFRRAIITLTFLGGLASTVFIPLMAWLIAHIGWRDTLLVLASFQLLVCAPIHFLGLRGAPKRSAIAPVQSLANSAASASMSASASSSVASSTSVVHSAMPAPAREPFKPLLRSKAFLYSAAFNLTTMSVTVALPAHMISLLQESGLPPLWVVAIPATIGAVQVLGRMLLLLFERHMNIHKSNRWITWLLPLGLLCLIFSNGHPGLALAFVMFFGLGNGLLTIIKGTIMASYVSQAHVATLNGAIGVPVAIARSSAPLVLGLLWSPEAGYTYGLWLLWGLSIAGALALVGAQRSSRIRLQ